MFDVPNVELGYLNPDSQSLNPNALKPGQYADSPQGTWRYFNSVLPAGIFTTTCMYDRHGYVVFDGDVPVPTLASKNESGKWNKSPHMTLTPAALLSLREGIERAKGTVVVAGLGLGYPLIEISKKESVEKIILVETSRDLIEWILPEAQKHMESGKLQEVIVGNPYVEVPKLRVTTAIINLLR